MVRAEAGGDAAGWAARYRDALRAVVAEQGCALVRGLGLRDAAGTGAVFRRLAAGMMAEKEAFAPRQPSPGGLYSVTPWPANQQMCMHHELSYALEFPGLLLFACLTAPAGGGATGVADGQAVLRALPASLVQRIEREGWVLTRNYNEDIGASVEQAFGTGDRHAVESYLFGNGNPVGADVVDLLNATYEAHTAREPWQAGDLLLVDNIRTAHSREPYDGPREVLAALADPVHLADCSPATEGTPR